MSEKNFSTKKKVVRTLITAGILLALIAAVYLTLKFTGVLDRFKTAEDIKEFILSTGVSGRLIFVLLQFLQVTFVPLPAMVTTVAGTLIFGPWETMFLSIFAIMAGRLFAFFLEEEVAYREDLVGNEDVRRLPVVGGGLSGDGRCVSLHACLFPLPLRHFISMARHSAPRSGLKPMPPTGRHCAWSCPTARWSCSTPDPN